jgi:hypothetical protein
MNLKEQLEDAIIRAEFFNLGIVGLERYNLSRLIKLFENASIEEKKSFIAAYKNFSVKKLYCCL